MKARKVEPSIVNTPARLTGIRHSYLEVAGTNIEDMEQALKSAPARFETERTTTTSVTR
jgi:hypothetical protein